MRSPYAVAVSSCTAALEITLRFFCVEGREVIVPTNTFVASANAVRFAGGTPVLADIDPKSLCLDIGDLHRKFNRKTSAVIVVHIAGLVHPRLEEIRRLCKEHHVALIEDVAHAAGATYHGRAAGTIGDAGCFSFYPTKIITCGTGGMIITPHEDLAHFALSLRHHGAGMNGLTSITHLGNDWLLDEMRAAVGLAQLRQIEHIIALRRSVAVQYTRGLRKLKKVCPLPAYPRIRHVYYKYAIECDSPEVRDRLVQVLGTRYGIDTGSIYYPPVHRQPLYAREMSRKRGGFPHAEDILPRVLCLPIYAQMLGSDIRRVLLALRGALEEVAK